MSFWNSMRSTSGSGGLNPIVQKVPMPSVMPAQGPTAGASLAKPSGPFAAQLAAAKSSSLTAPTAVSQARPKPAPAPAAAAQAPVAPPPAPKPAPVAAPVQVQVQVQVQAPKPAPAAAAPELPKASTLDPARLKAALLQAPRPAPAPAPAPQPVVQVPVPAPAQVPVPKPAAPSPMEAVALLRRALVLQARGDHAGAVAEFTAAIGLDGKCVEAWTGRGISKEHLGDPEGARRDYAKGIEIEVYAEIDRQRRLPPDLVA